jgi:hypothetical protein
MEPTEFESQLLMTIVIFAALIKTFFFLRVFESFAYIVTMLVSVLYDLRVFTSFYFMVVFLFGLVFCVLGTANPRLPGPLREYVEESEAKGEEPELPSGEYSQIGVFAGNLLYVFRTSIGDFDFDAAGFLEQRQNILFWFVWIFLVVITCITLLNFIIAEISKSYENVMESLEQQIQKERSSLIEESEDMIFKCTMSDRLFPKIIVKRQEFN